MKSLIKIQPNHKMSRFVCSKLSNGAVVYLDEHLWECSIYDEYYRFDNQSDKNIYVVIARFTVNDKVNIMFYNSRHQSCVTHTIWINELERNGLYKTLTEFISRTECQTLK